jgi:hypothetical protein
MAFPPFSAKIFAMNQNKFQLWKLALSGIHHDGNITPEEAAWFQKTITQLEQNKILNFSNEQIDQLKEVLHQPVVNFYEEFDKLDSPADRGLLLHYLRMVGHLDKDFSFHEKDVYQRLEKACLADVDLKAIESIVRNMEEKNYQSSEIKIHNKASFFESAFKTMLKIFRSEEGENS